MEANFGGEDKSRIEELKKKLYSKQGIANPRLNPDELHEKDYGVAEEWRRDDLVLTEREPTKSHSSFMRKLLLASIIFFVGALAVSAYLFFGKGNTISADKIELGVTGPVSVGGGDPLSFTVTLRNKNSIPILNSRLTVEYPDGTRSITDVSEALPRAIENIGELSPGAIIQRTEKAILFGEENDKKTIRLLLEYKVSGSNATFSKTANYEVSMNASPIGVTVESVKEISAGQPLSFIITIKSNSATVVQNVLLKAEYPFGFQFTESTPKPAFDKSIWTLGDIAPNTTKTIRMTGVLQGQDEEERIFRFSTGLRSVSNEKNLETTFTSLSQSVIIKKPFLGIDLTIDESSSSEHVSRFGTPIRGEILWSNNLPTPILDASIQVALSGAVLDKTSVEANEGFYQSLNNIIVWDKSNFSDLSRIEPGESGRVRFSFSSLPLQSLGSSAKNASLSLSVSAKGRRLGDNNAPEEINATAFQSVKFSSELALTSKVSRLGNDTGPLPPKAEKETTYSVSFTVLNSSNIVRGTTVTAELPNYVRWLADTAPSTENVTFDKNSNRVTWSIGDFRPTGSSGRTMTFRIALLPSISQIGSTPELVKNTQLTGEDQFTKAKLQVTGPVLTTVLSSGSGSLEATVTP